MIAVYIISLCYLPSLHAFSNTAIDLTWLFDNNTIYWENTASFAFTKQIAKFDSNGNWYAVNEFCSGEHGGTHFDAPYHFNKNGWKVGDVPVSRLITNGITINLAEETKILKDRTVLLPKHLIQWENKYGAIPPNSVILVNFDWAKYYSNKNEYLGIDEYNIYHFPGISKEAAEWIAKSENVVGVGVDTASIDPGHSTDLIAHRILCKKQIYLLENVKMPPKFPEIGFVLYVMPMNIKEGTGAPLRLIAQPTFAISASGTSYCNFMFIFTTLILTYFSHFYKCNTIYTSY